MELDKVKLETTWNDAAGSINSNFTKIAEAIESGGGSDSGGGSLNEVNIVVDDSSESYIGFTDGGIDGDGSQKYTVEVLTKGIEGTGDGVATAEDVRTYLTTRLSAKVL